MRHVADHLTAGLGDRPVNQTVTLPVYVRGQSNQKRRGWASRDGYRSPRDRSRFTPAWPKPWRSSGDPIDQ